MNIRAIARQLTMERIPTKIDRHKTSGHKQYGEGRWCVPSIHHILRNETYVGTMYWNKRQRITKTRLQKRDRSEWLAIPVPVIVSPGLFEAVQQKIAHNRALSKRNRKHEYLLLRGRLRCGRWS